MAFENSLSSFPASLLLSCEPQVDGQILGKRLTPGKPRPYRLSFFSLHTWGTVSCLLGRSHVDESFLNSLSLQEPLTARRWKTGLSAP